MIRPGGALALTRSRVVVPLVVPLLTVAVLTAAVLTPVPVVKAVAGVGLLLVAPGWVVLDWLLGIADELDPVPRAVARVVISIGLVMLTVVGMAAVSVRVTRGSLVASIDVLIAALYLLGAVRQSRRGGVEREPVIGVLRRVVDRRTAVASLTAVAIAVLATAGVSAAFQRLPKPVAASPYSAVAFGGSAADFDHPISVTAGQQLALPIVVWNRTGHLEGYSLSAALEGAISPAGALDLAPGARSTETVGVAVPPAPPAGCLARLTVSVRAPDGTDSVGLWLRWTGTGSCP